MIEPQLDTDLLRTSWVKRKCISSRAYAQNLYAALCNNRFFKDDKEWSCSWRESGSIISEIIGEGDYMDWYCSGIWSQNNYYISEGIVTSEISNDLLNLGWTYKPYDPE